MKKITALFLALALCLSLCTVTAFAVNLPYSFDFETDPFSQTNGWTTIDADHDGYDWKTDTDELWDNNEIDGVDGSHCVVSRSYVNNVGPRNADNWLFSPAITIPADGAIVSWYEQSQDASWPDSYTVYVGETAVAQAYNESTAPNGMKVLYAYHEAANPWTQISVELSAENYGGKTVYIAFRHQSEDCYFLEIDDFAAEAVAPAHTHTVTFDANDGSVTPTSAETGTDGKLATLPTPTRSGYSFDGWYTMKEGGTKVDTNTVFTAAATIYAHWSRSFSFAHLPETGVATITVHEGDYYTGVAAKDAFILYWDENIKTNGDFILIDYVDTDINGYHSWTITIENGVPVATDGGFMEYYTTLDLINNEPFYASYDKWVNGTYTVNHTHNPELVNGQAPQKGIAGWKDYYECICGERYEDASGSILIPDLAVWKAEGGNGYLAPLAPESYTVTFNMNGHGT